MATAAQSWLICPLDPKQRYFTLEIRGPVLTLKISADMTVGVNPGQCLSMIGIDSEDVYLNADVPHHLHHPSTPFLHPPPPPNPPTTIHVLANILLRFM